MPRTRTGTAQLALLVIAAAILITYGLSLTTGGADSITGLVVSVEQASVTTISSLTLVDDSGKEWKFEGSNTFAGFTPSHLEEHAVLREPVTVEYERTAGGVLKILKVSD